MLAIEELGTSRRDISVRSENNFECFCWLIMKLCANTHARVRVAISVYFYCTNLLIYINICTVKMCCILTTLYPLLNMGKRESLRGRNSRTSPEFDGPLLQLRSCFILSVEFNTSVSAIFVALLVSKFYLLVILKNVGA